MPVEIEKSPNDTKQYRFVSIYKHIDVDTTHVTRK